MKNDRFDKPSQYLENSKNFTQSIINKNLLQFYNNLTSQKTEKKGAIEMSKKLKFKIISCSSQEPDSPSSSLLFGGQNGGWQTKRFCTYPQQVTFEFYGPVKIDKIQIISDNRKISSQVDILYYLPFQVNGRQNQQRFQKYGYLNFNRNQNSQMREQKSIMVDIKCLYLRFLFHKPYISKENFFSQIGIHQISIYGNDSNSNLAPIQRLPRQLAQTTDIYGIVGEEDPFVIEKLALLNAEKQRAIQEEDYQQANFIKQIIDQVKKYGEQLKRFHFQKRKAIEQQDYEEANRIKKSIQQQRRQLDQLVSNQERHHDQIIDENEFNNQPVLNDFQDNEFVDPSMNDIISKSGVYSSKGQNSRIAAGNSRIKINKTMLKRQNQKQKENNYDQRVIPTLANNNKTKTEESQLVEEEKKDLPVQDIDGKFIQYAVILQEHFQEETVKKLFSRHWKHKVEALQIILNDSKNKKVDPSFVKALIVVVKNSISQVNFQVASNTLQVFGDLLRLNAKGNLLNRTNELSNDLDGISKQIIKKMSDNNNKLRIQAEKSFGQMVTSSLYGPEPCVIALVKSKEKVKLSSKQLLSRLVEVQKIVDKNSNNQQIMIMAADFAIENANNPAAEVRNEALNLLMLCKDKDSTKIVEKKISEKSLSDVIEAHQNKAGSKSPQNLSKVKKTK